MSETQQTATWKIVTYWFLVTIFVLGVIGSTTAIWANVRIQENDAWAHMVGPLADDPAVQEFVVSQVVEVLDRQIAADDDAGRLESFSRSQLSGLVRVALTDFVASPTFATWWVEANRAAHTTIMMVINDEDRVLLQTHGGDLVLELQPVVDWVNGHIESLFPRTGYTITLPPERSVIVLYSSAALETAARVIDMVDTLSFVLPIITIVGLAGAIILRRNLGTALTTIALSLAIGMLFTLVILSIGRWWIVSQQPATHQDALDAMIRIVLIDLVRAFRAIAILALLRAGFVILLRSRYVNNPRVRAFLRDNREKIAVGGIGLAAILLVFVNYPPLWLTIGSLLLILTAGFYLLRWRKETMYPEVRDEQATET